MNENRLFQVFVENSEFFIGLMRASYCGQQKCHEPAVVLDSFWPYHTEGNLCRHHLNDPVEKRAAAWMKNC